MIFPTPIKLQDLARCLVISGLLLGTDFFAKASEDFLDLLTDEIRRISASMLTNVAHVLYFMFVGIEEGPLQCHTGRSHRPNTNSHGLGVGRPPTYFDAGGVKAATT
jgi:hypothetical protein